MPKTAFWRVGMWEIRPNAQNIANKCSYRFAFPFLSKNGKQSGKITKKSQDGGEVGDGL